MGARIRTVQPLRNPKHKVPRRPHEIPIPTIRHAAIGVPTRVRAGHARTMIFAAVAAFRALRFQAGGGLGAEADAVADPQVHDVAPDADGAADDFMADADRVDGWAAATAEGVDVGVACELG